MYKLLARFYSFNPSIPTMVQEVDSTMLRDVIIPSNVDYVIFFRFIEIVIFNECHSYPEKVIHK